MLSMSSTTAASLLSIHFARRSLRRRIPAALARGDKRTIGRLYSERDELARIALGLAAGETRGAA